MCQKICQGCKPGVNFHPINCAVLNWTHLEGQHTVFSSRCSDHEMIHGKEGDYSSMFCPYADCKHEIMDFWDYNVSDGGEIDCPNCERDIQIQVVAIVTGLTIPRYDQVRAFNND